MTEDSGPVPGGTADPDDVTVALVSSDFRKRRRRQRLRRFRPLIIAVLVALLAGFAVWTVYFSPWLTVRGVEVSGNTTLSSVRIERIAKAPLDKPLARVDLAAIQARVEALPAVKQAAVSRSWPHTVHIEVTERTAIATLNRGNGWQGVDEEGVLFGSYPTRPLDLPLMVTEPDVQADALAEGTRVLRSLRPDIAAQVKSVNVETIDEITLEMSDGRDVIWGSADDSTQKAEVLAILLERKDVDKIDVSVPGRPTTR